MQAELSLRETAEGCVCSGRCERAVSADIHRYVEQCRFLLREFRVEPRTRQGLDGVRKRGPACHR